MGMTWGQQTIMPVSVQPNLTNLRQLGFACALTYEHSHSPNPWISGDTVFPFPGLRKQEI